MKLTSTILLTALTFAFKVSSAALTDNRDSQYVTGFEIKISAGPPQVCGDPRHAGPFYRAWNGKAADHFYTSSLSEVQSAIRNSGYTDEGIAGYLYLSQDIHTIPLYRMWQPDVSDHFYTTDAAEAERATRNGYRSEGIAGYIYPDSNCGGLPLYRMWNGASTDHFYTMSPAERDTAVKVHGYTYEGVTGYMFPF
ncbi:hypothetical protein B0H34DRAFT_795463 [Crassisporium funariophilum]|nr:hypothetical protein B0H34DRAFT_795463 [Crassisporium funariophilum]